MSTGHRKFAHRRILEVTTGELESAVQLLAHGVLDRFGWPDAVIGIANGGLEPARRLGEALHSPVFQVAARHNLTSDTYLAATGEVTCDVDPLTQALDGQDLGGLVLLVDDICGTGATFEVVRPALAPLLPDSATVVTVVLCLNEGSAVRPDLWLWNVDDWVWFPWEPAPAGEMPIEAMTVPRQVRP